MPDDKGLPASPMYVSAQFVCILLCVSARIHTAAKGNAQTNHFLTYDAAVLT